MIHGEFRMEHSRRWEDIINDLTPWLSDQRHGMYYQHLQCPNTTNLGWLLWSFRKIDITVLQTELLMQHGINVTLRYQNIILNRGKSLSNNKVMALHVISNKTEADKVAAVLKDIYPFDKHMPSFPLGIVLRFIPHIFRVKRDKLQKITRLRDRQDNFLKTIENTDRPMNATSWEILTLDTRRDTFGTLRSQIMEVCSRDRSDSKLFLSVDTSFFRSNEIIFTFLPRHETEARAFVTNIVSFFLHKFNEETIKEFFHSEAIVRAKGLIWNAETREIESSDDAYLNNSGDGIDDFDFMEAMGIDGNPTNNNIQQPTDRVERLFLGEDSESIGTLFTNNQPGLPTTNTQNHTIIPTTTPAMHNRGTRTSGGSVGGHSSGTTFTTEEATTQIILLTEGFRNLEMMMMAMMQQQGVPMPTTMRTPVGTFPPRNNQAQAPIITNNASTITPATSIPTGNDIEMQIDTTYQEVDHTQSQKIDQDEL
jgi:hypothetical protein